MNINNNNIINNYIKNVHNMYDVDDVDVVDDVDYLFVDELNDGLKIG